MKLIAEKSSGYELLDSGGGEKLERFGEIIIRRPDLQALWPKKLSEEKWRECHAFYERTGVRGKWHWKTARPQTWKTKINGITFLLDPQPSKHIGLFPEQSSLWQWLEEKIQTRHKLRMDANDTNKTQVLNLFGYTGGATLACAAAGAEVSHVDASEYAINCAKSNRDASGLESASIRFFVDDARRFVEREIRRGKKYDVILLDPPSYGKGAKKEIWNLENDFPPLLLKIKKLLSKDPLAIVLGGYSSIYSPTTYENLLGQITSDFGGTLDSGELFIRESSSAVHLLPCGIFARWGR